MKLSVIIVNYNTAKLTLDCLRSIFAFSPRTSFEVIVVDNGSEETIEPQISEHFPAVKFIATGTNVGFARANNLGIFNARGEYLLLLNSDTCLIESTLDRLVDHLDSHPQVGAAGPRHLDGERQFQLSCGHFPGLVSEIMRKLAHYRLSLNDTWVRDYLDNKYAQSEKIDWVSGSCLLLRRKALEQVGLLDERFFMYFEDIDLCWRLTKAGWDINYVSETSLLHYGGQSAKINLMNVYVEYRISQIYFTRKYYGVLGSLGVRSFLIFKYGFHGLKWGLVYLVRALFKSQKSKMAYTMLLLTKKIVFLSFSRISVLAQEPKLSGREAAREPARRS